MPTVAELLELGRENDVDVKTSDTKSVLESKLAEAGVSTDTPAETPAETSDQPTDEAPAPTTSPVADGAGETLATTPEGEDTPENASEVSVDNKEEVQVNANENGEATNGTTLEGDESPVDAGDNIPQNGVTDIKTGEENSNQVSVDADDSRTEEEVKFADEANPNNKARVEGAGGSDYDQDGNLRTGGKSYGIAANGDTLSDVFSANNAGEAPERVDGSVPMGQYLNPVAGSDGDTNNHEWTRDSQKDLAEELSEPENGIRAVVSTSMGDYVRVKFLRNGLAFGTYKSRDFTVEKAKQYLADLKDGVGL